MSKQMFPIDEKNIAAVRAHIRREFKQKSWWPAEAPLQSKNEFEKAQHSPQELTDWCAKWLDGSQWRQLKHAVDKAASCS
jgi:hypothetical protein